MHYHMVVKTFRRRLEDDEITTTGPYKTLVACRNQIMEDHGPEPNISSFRSWMSNAGRVVEVHVFDDVRVTILRCHKAHQRKAA